MSANFLIFRTDSPFDNTLSDGWDDAIGWQYFRCYCLHHWTIEQIQRWSLRVFLLLDRNSRKKNRTKIWKNLEKFYLPEISHDGESDSWKCRGQGRWWTWFSYFFQHYIKDFLQQLCSLIWLEELNRATETNFNQLSPAIQKQDFWLDELIFPIRLLNPSQHLENVIIYDS